MNDYGARELPQAGRPRMTDAALRLSLAVHRASQSMQELAEAWGCASQLRVRALTASELGA